MRNKLIELIQDATDEFAEEGWKHFECVGTPPFSHVPTIYRSEFIADHLIDNGVTIQKWIPVEERLPENDFPEDTKRLMIRCLVFTNKGTVKPCVRQRWVGSNGEMVPWEWNKTLHAQPTHWMHLPKGTKEQ